MVSARTWLVPFAIVLLLPRASVAQTVRLNGPLVQPGVADVVSYAFDPSSARMVFRADLDVDQQFELYSSPSDASAPPLRLVPGVPVSTFELAPGRVAYLVTTAPGRNELYEVPTTGGTPLLLSGPLVSGGSVFAFDFTPDGSRVVFGADKLLEYRYELFSVPIDGSAPPVQLDPTQAAGVGLFRRHWMTPDGKVLFSHTRSNEPFDRLYSVPADGSGPVIMLGSMPRSHSYGQLWDLQITADGTRAVLTSVEPPDDINGPGPTCVFSVPVDGSSALLQLDSFPGIGRQELVAVGSRGLFLIGDELISYTLDGSERVKLNRTLGPVSTFAVSPDGATVCFGTPNPLGGLYRVPIDGSQVATLVAPGDFADSTTDAISFAGPNRIVYRWNPMLRSASLAGGGDLVLSDQILLHSSRFGVTADGLRAVFLGAQTSGVTELFSVPVDGSAPPLRISAAMSGTADALSFALPPTGSLVAYLADPQQESTDELFVVPAAGPSAPVAYVDIPLGGPVLGDVVEFRVAPDGRGVVYRADEQVDEQFALLDTVVRGLTVPEPISAARDADGFQFSSTGEYVVFSTSSPARIFSSRRTGAPSLVMLDTSNSAFTIANDGAVVVYRHDSQLRSVPIDHGTTPTVLAPQFSLQGTLQISPDSTRVVFSSDSDFDRVYDVFSVPIAGGVAPAVLNPPLAASNQGPRTFAITADSSTVVYLGYQDAPNVQELYAVPIDGSGAARKLNGPLVGEGDVTTFVFAGATQVVYRADQTADGRMDLFGVDLLAPVPTAVPLTKLTGTRVAEADFRAGAAGAFVFYRADANTAGVQELFRVRIDGATPPVRLSAPLAAGGDVASFALSPDGQRVVYLADQNADNVFELFSRATVGGPLVALDPLPAFADVLDYQIAPDSGTVVWRADRNADGVIELFAAPLDGSAPAVRLNDPLPLGGDVQPDFVALPEGRALYRADQESDEVFELFFAAIEPFAPGEAILGPRGPLPKPPPIVR